MGGSAFAKHSPPIPTPRLSPGDYYALKDILLAKLASFYGRVAAPIEGPGKTSFGDIDIVVCHPRFKIRKDGEWLRIHPDREYNCAGLSGSARPGKELRPEIQGLDRSGMCSSNNAQNGLHTSNAPMLLERGNTAAGSHVSSDHSFPAASWCQEARFQASSFGSQLPVLERILQPAARSGRSFAIPKHLHLQHQPEAEASYVQVDITVLETPEGYAWHWFMQSHGDMWNMLSPSLRRVGLVLTDQGFCLSHRAIERKDRRRGRIVLTRDPSSALRFVGLEETLWWGVKLRAGDRATMLRHALPLTGEYVPHNSEFPAEQRLVGRSFATEESLFQLLGASRFFDPTAYNRHHDLKSADRRRIATRGTYRRFCEEWVPRYAADAGKEDESEEAQRERMQARAERRAAVAQEALDLFGKREEWEESQRLFVEEQAALVLKHWAKAEKRVLAEWAMEYADAWILTVETKEMREERILMNNVPQT